ncbi:hypothetical protein I7I48_00752 [Histoplasma ohiense]|nr:hypothetical protein I7I48_00752 [Histoplasma ohiense (nom. inval.)]
MLRRSCIIPNQPLFPLSVVPCCNLAIFPEFCLLSHGHFLTPPASSALPSPPKPCYCNAALQLNNSRLATIFHFQA